MPPRAGTEVGGGTGRASDPPSRGRLWAALIPAALLPLLLAWLYFVAFAGEAAARPVYAAAKAFLLLWPLLACRFLLGERALPSSRGGGTPRGPYPRALAEGLVSGLTAGLVLWALSETALSGMLAQAAPAVRAKAEEFGIAGRYALFAAGASLFHATAEEYYWRWFVFGRLRRLLPAPGAHLAAAAAFAAHHVLVGFVFLPGWSGALLGALTGLGGLLWSLQFARHRNLAGAWASHLAVDLFLFAIGWRLLAGS